MSTGKQYIQTAQKIVIYGQALARMVASMGMWQRLVTMKRELDIDDICTLSVAMGRNYV